MLNLDDLLTDAIADMASDIHLCEGQPPVFRIHGKLTRKGELPITGSELADSVTGLIPSDKADEFRKRGEVDFSYALPGVGRFRVNAYRQRGSFALSLRAIPFKIQALAELGLPEVLASVCEKPYGLVVITGPTGSGKSTTLASLIDWINEHHERHIITLEDPIEFLHRHKKSVVNQREVGSDTCSFALGLRAALRQDPDVILLGEMRDLETMRICLQAAETGHLVFATLHTNDAASTVDRIIDVFPAEQQQQVRMQLAATLQGVAAQRLFTRMDGHGRVLAMELLMITSAVRNLIREGKSHQIASAIQTGGKLGMRTMASSVAELYEKGLISWDDHHSFAEDLSAPGPAEGSLTGYVRSGRS